MKKALQIISLLFIVSVCATIQEYETLTQDTDVLLSTSVNGVIFKIQKEKDLPNAFAKKDIYGGMVDQGEKVLRFRGLNEQGNLVLRLTDIDIKSNENVFTRYGIARVTPSFPATPVMTQGTMIGGNQAQNQVTTITNNNTVVVTDAPEARIDRLPENVYEFEFDYRQNKILDLGYIRVSFEDVSAYSIRYVLSE